VAILKIIDIIFTFNKGILSMAFFSNYWQNELNTINSNIHDITNIGYTYFLLAIVIKLFREGQK